MADKEGLLLSKPADGKVPEKLYFIKRDSNKLESRYGKVGSKNVGVTDNEMKSVTEAQDIYQGAVKTKMGKGYVKVKELTQDHKNWLGLPITKKKKVDGGKMDDDVDKSDKSDADDKPKKDKKAKKDTNGDKSDKDDGGDDSDGGAKTNRKDKDKKKPKKKKDDDDDDDDGDDDGDDEKKTKKSKCKYGMDCRRQNPTHFKEYSHPKGFKKAPPGDADASDSDALSKKKRKRKRMTAMTTNLPKRKPKTRKQRRKTVTAMMMMTVVVEAVAIGRCSLEWFLHSRVRYRLFGRKPLS